MEKPVKKAMKKMIGWMAFRNDGQVFEPVYLYRRRFSARINVGWRNQKDPNSYRVVKVEIREVKGKA